MPLQPLLQVDNPPFLWREAIPAIKLPAMVLTVVSHPLQFITLGVLLLHGMVTPAIAEPVIPAISNQQLEPEIRGQILIEEMNCVACHQAEAALSNLSKQAPRLSEVGSRVNPAYLEAFIREPHGTKPGTTMPDILGRLAPEERAEAATSLTQFLLSLKKNEFNLQPPDTVAAGLGHRLFHSRGCAACHAPRDEHGVELPVSDPVPLGKLERKYSFKSLLSFLQQPHASRPSGRMPDMRLQGQDAERITHFLLQDTRVPGSLRYTQYGGRVWEGLDSAEVRAERAGYVKDFSLDSLRDIHHHTVLAYDGWLKIATKGRYTFYLGMNGGSLILDGNQLLKLEPSDRRGIKQLQGAVDLDAGWRRIEMTYFHTGQEPKFSFEMEGPGFKRQPIPSSMLSVSNERIPSLESPAIDAKLAARGRDRFSKLGCANCHNDLQLPATPATPFAMLNPASGCLSGGDGTWPKFAFSPEQKSLITEALPHAEHPNLDDKQQINKTLARFNCLACHERSGLGGVSPERRPFFTGTQPSLGDQGRLPPPLSDVGAKLKPAWLAEVLLHGKRQRDYLDASMPQFGEANVGHLVELFGRVDELEKVIFPKVADLQESKDAGYQLMGTNGLACIACHEFNGQKSGEISALDISHVPERLNKNWFNLYMRQPSRFHPTVIMPSYWPDGKSTRPNILEGDTAMQIEALWTYLEDGPRARKPLGLSRQSNELRVGDVTEMCRGQSPLGYRSIGVGYPERINLAFDAGEMALRQLWKGDFASVDLGHWHPRGTDTISFPPGVPFHHLQSLEDNWPYKGKNDQAFPQDHGYQFRGYHLNQQRRPTFLYLYGDIAVEDFFEDVRDSDGRAYFKRSLTFETPNDHPSFYFRAAAGKKVTAQSDRSFSADQLKLRITSEHKGIVRDGGEGEILIPLTPPKGRSVLTLEYEW